MPSDGITRGKNCSRRNRELVLCSAVYKTIVAFLWKPSYTDNFCPLHHVAGVVQVPFFPALRYFALGWSRTPIRTPLELHACCLLSFFASFVVVGVCLVFCPLSRFVVVFMGCAWCQLTEVTKDCRGPPAQPHTHTLPPWLPPPFVFLWEVGLSLNSFVLLFVLAVLLPCPLARLSCFVRGVGFSRP